MPRLILTPLLLALGACAGGADDPAQPVRVAAAAVGEAMASPLKDLNLVRDEMPEILRMAMKDAYQKPRRDDCEYLEWEVRQLDLALGPDIDVPASANQKGAATTSAEAVGAAAAGAVATAAVNAAEATEWIPLRALVRQLTGAEKNAQELKAAVHAGDVRRGYLKGLGLERGCAHPAAPLPAPPPKAKADPSEVEPAPQQAADPAPQPAPAPATPASPAAPTT